jgi:hypothetical protein
VRAIANRLAQDAGGGELGTACVESATADYVALDANGHEVLVALGRIRDGRGARHDHAWVLDRQDEAWTVRDRAVGVRSREPLVLLSRDAVWTTRPARTVPALHPEFFLSMHCQINDKALKGVFDGDAIDDINYLNVRVDDPFSHPNYDPREHFDNALITESILLLEDRLLGEGPLHTIRPGVLPAVPRGLACHAVADFYSHSNYAPMALAYYEKPDRVLPIDQAITDLEFVRFVTTSWENLSMWHDYKGYATTVRPHFAPGFERCLFSGAYGGDGWNPREGIPHHDDFAVDQPTTAWSRADKIVPRRNPFAPPGPWTVQYRLRLGLAAIHLRAVIDRSLRGDPTPFLGEGQKLPPVMLPPPWRPAATMSYLVRGSDGRPEESIA